MCEIAEATAVYSMPSYPEDDPEPEEGKGLLFGYTACRRGSRTGVGAEILVVISSWSSRHLACLLLHLHSLVTLELSEVEDLGCISQLRLP